MECFIKLNEFQAGQKAKIVDINTKIAPLRQKLFALGLIPGAILTVTYKSWLKGGVAVTLPDNSCCALGVSDSKLLIVEKC